jgi:hypothetical protein
VQPHPARRRSLFRVAKSECAELTVAGRQSIVSRLWFPVELLMLAGNWWLG